MPEYRFNVKLTGKVEAAEDIDEAVGVVIGVVKGLVPQDFAHLTKDTKKAELRARKTKRKGR